MAADVTSVVRSGPRGVNFRVPTRNCGFAMRTTANLQYASRLLLQPLSISLHGRVAGIRVAFAAPNPARPRPVLVACRLNFASIRTRSALAH